MAQAEVFDLAQGVGPDGARLPARDVADAPPRSRGPLTCGAVLGSLTFLTYLPGLGRSLDFDSAQTVGTFVREGPPWSVFARQAVFNNHPAFSFLEQLVRVATGATGAAAMRVLPVLFGAVAAGVLTWFAARRLGVVSGLVAGTLLACNPTFATLSRAVRGYSLLTLCAIVSTVLVAARHGDHQRRHGVGYVVAAGVGLATHLYMLPVIAAHVGAVVAQGRWDRRWRMRFEAVLGLAGLAYVAMAGTLLAAAGAHGRVFQADLPGSVAVMATGGGWASLAVAPLLLVGVIAVSKSRAFRGGAIGLAAVLVPMWAVLQSSALTERFLVWLVPAAAYLAAVGASRFRAGWVLGAGSAALAVAALLPGYTSEPTGYRQAAAVLMRARQAGERGCVVRVGVPPMRAYLETPRDFARVDDPAQLDSCDVVVVAAWWRSSNAEFFARDRVVIAAAEREFPERLVLAADDKALVLSRRPLAP